MAAETISPQLSDLPADDIPGIIKPQFSWDALSIASRSACIAHGDFQIKFRTPWGPKFGWDVAGPAQAFWNDVLVLRIKEYFETRRAQILRGHYWDGACKCFMVGRFRHTARPTVVIMCDQRGVAKRFAKIIRQDAKFQASRFDLVVWEGVLEFRGENARRAAKAFVGRSGCLDVEAKELRPGALAARENIFGAKVRADMGDATSRTATLGGVIDIDGETWGLTVAHLFRTDQFYSAAASRCKDEAYIYDPLEEDTDDDSDDSSSSDEGSTFRDARQTRITPSYLSHKLKTVYLHYSDNILGYYDTLPAWPQAHHGLDWALVKIPSCKVEHTNRREFALTLSGFPGFLNVSRLATAPPKVVCLANDSKDPLDTVESYLSGTVALISLPGSSELIEAYTISNRSEPGESGTWAVDFALGDAFGMVVAQASNSNLTFVVPLSTIFKSIAGAWPGAKVGLPLNASTQDPDTPLPQSSHSWIKDHIQELMKTPRAWEDPEMLKQALSITPAPHQNAPDIQLLLGWFNTSFFSWLGNPDCSTCGNPTRSQRLFESTSLGRNGPRANGVEVFRCTICHRIEQSHNYAPESDVLQRKSGHFEEGKRCFGLLCRVLGFSVRWVWSLGDYSWSTEDDFWLEFYLPSERRWVHLDPALGIVDPSLEPYDSPLEYSQKLKKRVTCCVAVSIDGAYDVTRRYCHDPAGSRDECRWPASAVVSIAKSIRETSRANLSSVRNLELQHQDAEEEQELQSTVATESPIKDSKAI